MEWICWKTPFGTSHSCLSISVREKKKNTKFKEEEHQEVRRREWNTRLEGKNKMLKGRIRCWKGRMRCRKGRIRCWKGRIRCWKGRIRCWKGRMRCRKERIRCWKGRIKMLEGKNKMFEGGKTHWSSSFLQDSQKKRENKLEHKAKCFTTYTVRFLA